MVFTAPILATKSVAFALSNAMTGTETRKAQVAFLHSIVSLSQFHIFERFALHNLCSPSFNGHEGLPLVGESVVAAKLVVFGLSLCC